MLTWGSDLSESLVLKCVIAAGRGTGENMHTTRRQLMLNAIHLWPRSLLLTVKTSGASVD